GDRVAPEGAGGRGLLHVRSHGRATVGGRAWNYGCACFWGGGGRGARFARGSGAPGKRPTSWRMIVPRCAACNRPGLARRASVKAPRSNPNISASSRVSGIGGQLKSTN